MNEDKKEEHNETEQEVNEDLEKQEKEEIEEEPIQWDTSTIPENSKRVFVFTPGKETGFVAYLDSAWCMPDFLTYLLTKDVEKPQKVFVMLGGRKAEIKNIRYIRDGDKLWVTSGKWGHYRRDRADNEPITLPMRSRPRSEYREPRKNADESIIQQGVEMPFRFIAEEWAKTPKSCLQEWSQKYKTHLHWAILYSESERYLVQVTVDENAIPHPNFFSMSHREAEHNAAIIALLQLNKLDAPGMTAKGLQEVLLPKLVKNQPKKKRKREGSWTETPTWKRQGRRDYTAGMY